MKGRWKILLVLVIVVCFGVAVSYPIRYWMEDKSTEESMDRLLAMRDAGLAGRGEYGRPTASDGEAESGELPEEEAGEVEAGEADAGNADTGTVDAGIGAEPGAGSASEGRGTNPAGAASGSSTGQQSAPQSGEAQTDTVIGAQPNAGQPNAGQTQGNPSTGTQPTTAPNANGQANTSQAADHSNGTGQNIAQGAAGSAQGGQTAGNQTDASQSAGTQVAGNQTAGNQAAAGQNPGSPSANAGAGASATQTTAPQAFGAVTGGAWPIIDYSALMNFAAQTLPDAGPTPEPTATPVPTPTPLPTPSPTPVDRFERDEAVPYDMKEKKTLDVDAILPQYREIYEENNDFVGWLAIPGTNIDYPVVQCEDSDYYLKHDFFGNRNANGQIILDTKCDPYTPSYNLVISGHSMKSGKMFGYLVNYMYESYWKKHRVVYFDTLMEQKTYLVYAAFFSADYDVDEEGFRYNADIGYSLDARQWLREIKENELYDTGVDAGFGDEFLTLTTCNHVYHKDGRFVVICRRLREGEEIE